MSLGGEVRKLETFKLVVQYHVGLWYFIVADRLGVLVAHWSRIHPNFVDRVMYYVVGFKWCVWVYVDRK